MPKVRRAKRQAPKAVVQHRPRARANAARVEPVRLANTEEGRYLRALYDPFNAAPARVPDLISVPTSVCSSVTRFTVTSQDGTGSQNQFIRVNVFPHIGSTSSNTGSAAAKASIGSSYDAQGAPLSRTYVRDPLRGPGDVNTGGAYSNFSTYRTVGMGLRVMNITPELYRAGTCAVRLTCQGGGSDSPELASVFQIQSDRESTVFDAASLRGKGKYWVWHPENYATDLNMSTPDTTNFMPQLQFAYAGPGQITEAQQFLVEVVTHYEFVPYPRMEMLFDMASSIGSPARVQNIMADCMSDASLPESASPEYGEKIAKILDRVLGTAEVVPEAALHFVRRARQTTQSVLAPFR